MQYSWRPQAGTQLKAITATWCEELFFGGARGGGKSDFLLGDFAQDVNIYKENWHGIIFRKIAKELDELIKRSNQIFTPMGAVFKVQEKKWIFPNGATFRLAFLERDDDADKYQGLFGDTKNNIAITVDNKDVDVPARVTQEEWLKDK